jgi:dGTPase
MHGRRSVRSRQEHRSEFERDYGRTIYSAPFRRLKEKAQVFPLEESDYVRTRLLHSQEVSSVAEDLASQLVKRIPEMRQLKEEMKEAIPLIVATCGLIHDLGNPPFGHAGELAISTWFQDRLERHKCLLDGLNIQEKKDFLRFEGNAHTLRIISNMRLLIDDFGLNYTCATLSAARKYVSPSNLTDEKQHSKSKPGFFSSEAKIVKLVQDETGTEDCRHPLTFIVEAADDIVYSVVDLEDGIKRKVLDWHRFKAYLEKKCKRDPLYHRVVSLADKQVKGAEFNTNETPDEIMAQVFRIAAVSELAIAVRQVFEKRYEAIMQGDYVGELVFDDSSAAGDFVAACKQYARENLYTSADILKLEIRGRRVIHDLMDLFWESVRDLSANSFPVSTKSYPGKIYRLISQNYREVFEERLQIANEHPTYCKLQLITDYLAGMTDPFACRLHRELTNV